MSASWFLYTPVLLTLLDDPDTNVRSEGLVLLDEFLGKLPEKILHNSGLAQLFAQAIFPTLLFRRA